MQPDRAADVAVAGSSGSVAIVHAAKAGAHSGGTYRVVAFAALGGVLFGLDQGNWGGAIVRPGFVETFCRGTFEECHDATDLPLEYARFLSWGSSLLQLGAAVGALGFAPPCAASFGRRETMFLGSLLTVAGALAQAVMENISGFLTARVVAGLGVGFVTYALPMFVSEVAPAEVRGSLGCSMQLMLVFGSLVASVLNCQTWFSYKLSFALPAVPAAILAAGIFCFPVSPRFALMRGRRLGVPGGGVEAAWRSLRRLRGSDAAADAELQELREAVEAEEVQVSWPALWRDASIRRRLLVANMLQWLQQFTGINAILSYGPAIFQSAGLPISGLECAAVTNSFNLAATFAMMLVIDVWGRRALLLLGAAAMLVFMGGAASMAFFIEGAADGGGGPATPLLGWALLGCVCLYMFSFAIAWGGVPWVYPSEIFPMSVKEKALSTSVFSQWAANCAIAYVVPQQVQAMKVTGTFFFYAFCLVGCFTLVYRLVPETKGLEMEAMGPLFDGAAPAGSSSATRPLLAGAGVGCGSRASRTRPRAESAPAELGPLRPLASPGPLFLLRRNCSDNSNAKGFRKVGSRMVMAPGGAVALF